MRLITSRLLPIVTLGAIVSWSAALVAQTPADIRHEVEQTLRDDRALRRLDLRLHSN